MQIFKDTPIKNTSEDVLGFKEHAKDFAIQISNIDGIDPLTIGIYGPWGCGKSSMINLVLEELNNIKTAAHGKQKYNVFHFSPWLFSNSNQLIQNFLTELSISLRKNKDSILQQLGKSVHTYCDVVSPIPIIGNGFKVVSKIGKIIARKTKGPQTSLEWKKYIHKIFEKSKVKTIIVIDDLDRLQKNEIVQIFQVVKSIADFPNTIFILAFDLSVITNSLGEIQNGDPLEYLEKIINWPWIMPNPSKSRLKLFLSENIDLKVKDLPEELKQTISEVFHYYLLPQVQDLRDAKIFLNSFSHAIIKWGKEINTGDIIAITMIKVFHLPLYEIMSKEYDLFCYRGRLDYVTGETEKEILQSRWNRIKDRFSSTPYMHGIKILDSYLIKQLNNFSSNNHESNTSDLKDCRLNHPELYARVFEGIIEKNEISTSEFNSIINSLNSKESLFILFNDLSKRNAWQYFFDQVGTFFKKEISVIEYENLLYALAKFTDNLPMIDEPSRFLMEYPVQASRSFSRSIVHEIAGLKGTPEKIIEELLLQPTIHQVPILLVWDIGIGYGRFLSKNKEEQIKLPWSLEKQIELENLVCDHIKTWYHSGDTIYKHQNFYLITYIWMNYLNDKTELKNLFSSCCTNTAAIKTFLPKYLDWSIVQNIPKRVFRVSRFNDVVEFIDIKNLIIKTEKIKKSIDYSKLTEIEKASIDLFLEAIKKNEIKTSSEKND